MERAEAGGRRLNRLIEPVFGGALPLTLMEGGVLDSPGDLGAEDVRKWFARGPVVAAILADLHALNSCLFAEAAASA